MNSISKLLAICCAVVLLAGCEEPTPEEILKQFYATGTITDEQAEILSNANLILQIHGLTSITDEEAESLGKLRGLSLPVLTSITDRKS